MTECCQVGAKIILYLTVWINNLSSGTTSDKKNDEKNNAKLFRQTNRELTVKLRFYPVNYYAVSKQLNFSIQNLQE